MRHILIISFGTLLAFSPLPATAQDEDLSESFDLFSQGTRLLLRGLMKEFEPAMRDLEGALEDLNAYHAPEVLPNGDIIIRRKVPLQVEPEVGKDGEVDL